jgi:phytoene synthase
MIDRNDLDHCRAAIAEGSYSFHAASKLLPARVRDPALALYAFCRVADDEVDFGDNKPAAVLALRDRLDLAYAGRPRNAPADRAMAGSDPDLPHAPRAARGAAGGARLGRDGAALCQPVGPRSYSARVASAVGAMMCVLMEVRDPHALARACDLGVAMQLTNIARDVGEDARAGRLYLPTDWMEEEGIDIDAFLADPQPSPQIRRIVKRLLAEANRLYFRSEPGIARLPVDVRPGIFAARHCYDAIGRKLMRSGYDSVTTRVYTTKSHKMGLLGLSILRAGAVTVLPESPVVFAPPLEEVAFLVEAAAHPERARTGWGDNVLSVLTQLESRERARRGLAETA